MTRTLACILVAVVLIVGCGGSGSSDSGHSGGSDSSGAVSSGDKALSAGDDQYRDPFRNPPEEKVSKP
jgi:hypothetical protein